MKVYRRVYSHNKAVTAHGWSPAQSRRSMNSTQLCRDPHGEDHGLVAVVWAGAGLAATLNLLRGFSSGGYGGLDRVGSWNLDFMANSERGADYLALAARVEEALQFLQAVGINTGSQFMKETEFYTAHECLLLDYEVRVGVGCENGALGGSRVLLSYSQITASSRAHAVARASGAAVFFSAAGCH